MLVPNTDCVWQRDPEDEIQKTFSQITFTLNAGHVNEFSFHSNLTFSRRVIFVVLACH